MFRTTALALAATFTFAAPANAANLLTNGDFEAPLAPNSPGYTTFYAGESFPGWSVTSGNVDVVAASFAPSNPSSGQWLDLVGFNDGTITQTFATTSGATYLLTFLYGNNPGGSPRSANVSVGNFAGTITSNTGLNYNSFSQLFTATGSSTTLTFASFGGSGNAGIALDNVAVTAVPEPASWAMMILGFGLVGGAMRRRQNVRVSFA